VHERADFKERGAGVDQLREALAGGPLALLVHPRGIGFAPAGVDLGAALVKHRGALKARRLVRAPCRGVEDAVERLTDRTEGDLGHGAGW